MNHAIYGFIAGFRNRQQLARTFGSSGRGLDTHSVDPVTLKATGIKVLALDFDGVLAPHGRHEPTPEAAVWLSSCCSHFGENRIYILSNKPTAERIAWFSSHFPGIRFISGVRKKPYPDGLRQVVELAMVKPEEVMLLDDRLLTGVLATILAGTQVTYISRPYIDMRGNPVFELFFASLRATERALLHLVPYNEH